MHLAILALLLAACTSCGVFRPAGQSVEEQYAAMVLIKTTCSDGRVVNGSGVMVSEDRVLTAAHVVACEILPGVPMWQAPNKIEVMNGPPHLASSAVVEVDIPLKDVARLKLADKALGAFFTPVRVGPPPALGDRVCVVPAVPRPMYRCGEALKAPSGHVAFAIMTEFGNSGGAVFDSRGRLVGILTNLARCQDDIPCWGWGTALAGYPWLVPGVAD